MRSGCTPGCPITRFRKPRTVSLVAGAQISSRAARLVRSTGSCREPRPLLVADLNEVCRFVEARTGVVFDLGNRLVEVQTIDRTKRAYKVRLYFKDFARGSDHITLKVRVDVTEHDRIYLPLQDRQLIHPYSDATTCATAIRCVKLEEALADKLKCLFAEAPLL